MTRQFLLAACATMIMLFAAPQLGYAADAANETSLPTLTADPALHAMLPERIRASGVLKLATDAHYPPCESFAEDNKTIIGWEPDFWTAVGQKLGVTVDVSSIAFDGLIPGLVSGRYDVAMECMSDTVEREQSVTFVDVNFAKSGIFTPADNTEITSNPLSLCGKRAASASGTTFANDVNTLLSPYCEKNGKKKVINVQFQSGSDALLALYSGRADFIIYSISASRELKKRAPRPLRLEEVPFFPKRIDGMAVKKGNMQLAKALLAAANAVKAEGVYDQIFKKWDIEALKVPEFGINVATTNPAEVGK